MMKTYLHAIDLSDALCCHNLSIGKRLWSPDNIARSEGWDVDTHRSLKTIPIDSFAKPPFPSGVQTPRMIYKVIEADGFERNRDPHNSSVESDQTEEPVSSGSLSMARIETNFEEVRRKIAPNAPSRLSCLYVTDNTPLGERLLTRMLGHGRYLVEVRIASKHSLHRADVRWFDKYCETQDISFIENYWQGNQAAEPEAWEYLLCGSFELTRDEQWLHIKHNGAKLVG
jgi:hypothetical protein